MDKKNITFPGMGVTLCILFLSFLGGTSLFSFAQEEKIKFQRITTALGISQNTIFSILQDKQGFLWFGTEGGLNRYDGYTFRIYEYEHDKEDSLSNNSVNIIFEDHLATLWVGTQKGLNKFDSKYESFIRIGGNEKQKEAPLPTRLSHSYVHTIYQDQAKILWIGTQDGLNKYNRKTGTFEYYKPTAFKDNQNCNLNSFRVFSIFQDRSESFWIGTGCGLYNFDAGSGEFKRHVLLKDLKVSEPLEVRTIMQDREGFLWIGFEGMGLLKYNPKSRQVNHFISEANIAGKLNCGKVRAIIEDVDWPGYLWIATHGGGLNRLDTRDQHFINFKEQRGVQHSLSNNMVYSLFRDRSGILWVGTEMGLNKLVQSRNAWGHWTVEPGVESSLTNNNVWAVYKDKRNILWLGTNVGLDKLDRKSGKTTYYSPAPNSLNGGVRVMSVSGDNAGYIWIGTADNGLNRFNPRTESFTTYKYNAGKAGSISENKVSAVLVDQFGTVWAGTKSKGLNRFDGKTKTFTHYLNKPGDATSLSHNRVSSIYQDPSGTIWIGTFGGVNRLNPGAVHSEKDGGVTFTSFRHDADNNKSLSNDLVSALHVDRQGKLWVGTFGGGLNKLQDPDSGTFIHYRKKRGGNGLSRNYMEDSMPTDLINGILEDKEGNLWISTDKGISKYNPGTNRFKNYDIHDGLQSNEFNGLSFFQADGDEEMFFGGVDGINGFYPQDIKDNLSTPTTVFTDFQVFYKSYLKQSVTQMKQIVLQPGDSVFSIEFAALDFVIPAKNKYRYIMEGVDPVWVLRDYTNRYAKYNQLSPGKHIFRVKGSNNDGHWGEEAVMEIIVLPPYWRTWWFQTLMGALLFLMLVSGYRMRTRYLREKLEDQIRVQQMLKQSHDEMENAKDLAELRHAENLKLLTAISSIFIAVDSRGFIFQWNRYARRFFGVSRNDAIKHLFVNVLKEYITEEKLIDIIEKGMNQEKTSKKMELEVSLFPGTDGIRLLLCNISPIRDQEGKKLGFLMVAEDITHRKEEEMLHNLSKKLEALGQMASGIAHEIKTPLQYIGHNARFVGDSFKEVIKFFQLVESLLPRLETAETRDIAHEVRENMAELDIDYVLDEVPKACEQIFNGVSKVSEIILSMTEYTFPGRGFKEKCDINGLIKSTLVVMQNNIKRNADIQEELFQDLPQIPCYPGELSQVFLNMLTNAVDAIEESDKWGKIKISTYLEQNEIVISISDTGTGIPESQWDNIFNPFFTTKEIGKGTGQGLSLAYNVVIEKHKGKLNFTSHVGQGTTFFIRLPIEIEGDQEGERKNG